MFWKKLPYWLKGGLIGLLIVILLLIYFFAPFYNMGMGCVGPTIICIISAIIFLPLFIVAVPLGLIFMFLELDESFRKIIFVVWDVIIFFLTGALIGLIIGKIKSKK